MHIDRHRVFQMQKVRQTKLRRPFHLGARLGQCRKFRVGRRYDHDVGRRLTKIDRLSPVVYGSRFCGKEVHLQSLWQSALDHGREVSTRST